MGKVLLILALAVIHVASTAAATATPQIEVVSKPYTNIAHVFGDSAGTLLSADGRWVAFSSSGNGLATNDNNDLKIDLFLTDMNTGLTTLISRNTNGASANGDSLPAGISTDGRFVLFESDASDLIADDDNDAKDVFIYDRDTGKITRVSADADAESGASVITRSGQFILFESSSENLDPKDQNGAPDLFLANRESGEIKLVTLNSNNTASASSLLPALNIGAFAASVSEDGRYVAYISPATNAALPRVQSTRGPQLFLRDMVGATNLWVSQDATHTGGQNVASPLLSTNGQVLAFLSSSLAPGPQSSQWLHIYSVESNILSEVPAPDGISPSGLIVEAFALSANGKVVAYAFGGQIYRYEIGGTFERITSGAGESASESVLSSDGGITLFLSSTNQPSGTTYPFQLFSYNATNKSVALLSPNLSKTGGGDRDMLFPVLSADGSKAGFTTYASDLVALDDKHGNDVFIVSTSGREGPVLVSVALPSAISATADGGSDVRGGAISSDGNWVAFTSSASDLVPNDDNGDSDVFLRDMQTGQTYLVSVSPDGVHPYASPSTFLGMSADGKRVAFTTIGNATSTLARNIFVYDRATGTNTLATVLPTGVPVAANEGNLSADGRYVAFWAGAPSNETYVRDLQTGETKQAANIRPTVFGGISPGGKYVRMIAAGNLLLVDWQTGQMLKLGSASGAVPPMARDDSALLLYGGSSSPGTSTLYLYSVAQNSSNLVASGVVSANISGDGSAITYLQRSADGQHFNLYVYEVSSGLTTPVDFPKPDPAFRLRNTPILSDDGHYLAFTTTSALVDGSDTNGFSKVYLYDRITKQLSEAGQRPAGSTGSFGSSDPALSADGRVVVFQSSAPDLVAGDLNVASDVFLVGTNPKNPNFALQLLSIPADGKVHVGWNTVAGKSYQLQFRESLSAGSWINSGNPQTATGNTLSAEASPQGAASGFYRVQLVP